MIGTEIGVTDGDRLSSDATMETFGEKVAHMLTRRGINASKLARKIGVPKSTLSNWMTGETEPKGSDVLKVARGLAVTTDFLLDPNLHYPPGIRHDLGAFAVPDDTPREQPIDARVPIRGVDATPPTTTARPARQPKPKRP